MAWNDKLVNTPTVASFLSAVTAMDMAFGAESWFFDMRYMSPAYCVARVTISVGEKSVIREYAAFEGIDPWSAAEVAFMRVYEFIGGKVNWPRKVEKPKVEQQPSLLPKSQGTPSAKPMAHSLPSSYTGPVPYNDSHTNIPPVSFPKPPQEPDWFGKGISGWATWQGRDGQPPSPWSKDMTWHDAVHRELENPGGQDQPLRWIMKLIGKDKQVKPEMRRPYADFIGKAKAACIWYMLAKDQKQQESEGYDDGSGGEGFESSMVPGEEVPF